MEADYDKIDKVINWPVPKNGEEVRQFTSFAGYYRRFVKDFSKISKPLTDLHPNTSYKNGKKIKTAKPFAWGKEQQEAFETLKAALSTPPVLGYADYNLPFEIHTDASHNGLGAVLYQRQKGKLRPICYASRGLKRSERNYPAFKLEFLALKWAITEKLHDYLYGTKFTVVTDNNPLTYALSKAKLDATGHRWLSSLACYDFNIIYRPGTANIDADILSRYPGNEDKGEISSESVKAICGCLVAPSRHTVSMSVDVLDATEFPGQPMAQKDMREIRRQQNGDTCIGFWIRTVKDRKKPDKKDIHTREDSAMLKSFNSLKIIRGLLYREVLTECETKNQLVLPSCFIEQVLKGLHNDMGHPNKDRTLSLLRDRFFWPGMTSDTDAWISNCDRCIKRKSNTEVRAPLVNITTTYPLELVCLDYLTLEPSKGNISNILVITDHFTRFAVAIPTRNQTAKTTADALYNEFIVRYGIPARLHSDQGANFQSSIIKELCQIMGIDKSRTSIYHAAGNGMTERFNRTLISMLGTLEADQKKNWKQYIAPLVQAYNCIKHACTGYSPYMLLFGREPRLPVDIAFGIDPNNNSNVSYTDYIKDLQGKISEAFDIVHKNADKARRKQKKYYDLKARAAKLTIGDRVLIKILVHDGKHKLSDRWADEVYVVTEQPNSDIPVYKVRKENGEGIEKVLHRNHLLHLGNALQDSTSVTCNSKPIPKPVENGVKEDKSAVELTEPRKPVPAPRKRRDPTNEMVDRSQNRDIDTEEDENVVVVTTTTELVPEEGNTEVAASVADTSADSSADGLEDTDLMAVGDAQEPDHISIQVEDLSVDTGDHIPVEINTETESSLPSGTEVGASANSGISGDTEQERSNIKLGAVPRRSSRTRKKPEWQESGEYCMSITKQSLMLQNFVSSCAVLDLDPKIISAVAKGISDSL